MRARGVALALLAALMGAAPVVARAAPAPARPWHVWTGVPGDNAGHGVVSNGEAIWTNYLFDDYGANVDGFESMTPDALVPILSPHVYPGDPQHPVGFAPSGNIGRFRHSGDYGYPPDRPYPQDPLGDPLGDNASYQNVANVAEVRVATDAHDVFLRFSLTDLGGDPALAHPRPDSTVIGLAIDTDPDRPAGGGAWPFSANLASSGWKRFLTVWGTGGAITTPDGVTRDLVSQAGGALREDLTANTVEVRIPRAVIASGGRHRWRLVAGAGRWDPAERSWAAPLPTTTGTTSPGSLLAYPRVYELVFHHGEPNSLWDDTKQADDLRRGTVDSDSWTVDIGRLDRGVSVPEPCRAGPREETFSSTAGGAPGEKGVVALPTQSGGAANLHNVNEIYRWQLQPLAVMLPPSACDPRTPLPSLDYFFHPANVNHNAWFVGVEGDHERVGYLADPPLGFSYVTALAARYNRITASGLGRTEGWNYGDAPGEEAADRSAFDAVTARYRHDPDHVRVVGMSGRLGAPFFAETWPGSVASMMTVSNHTADSPKIVNLRNTPWVFMHGTSFLELDSDLPGYAALDDHLNALGYQYLHMTWNGRGHDFNLVDQSLPLVEPWTSAARVHPAHISYTIDPGDRRPGVPLFPGVDWARGAAIADDRHPGQIDLTDLAEADRLPVRETRFDCLFTNVATTDDVEYHGLSYDPPAAVRARMPDVVAPGWSSRGCALGVRPLGRPAVTNGIAGTLRNVADVTLDLDQMGIDATRPLDLSGLTTTTPATLHLISRHGCTSSGPPRGSAAARRWGSCASRSVQVRPSRSSP